MNRASLPATIADEIHLEQLLSEPSEAAIEGVGRLRGDIMLLGIGGKMGPSLARMLLRASRQFGSARRIYGVSRFSTAGLADQLRSEGVDILSGDLLDERFVDSLPDVENVIFMSGMKFGTSGDPSLTWAMNTLAPALACRRFHQARIMAFSTGNVYPLVPVDSGGSRESDPPAPVGEYAMSALGRERTFEYFCRSRRIPTSIVRLNYAVEMRYGIVVDLARQIWNREPIDLSMGYANVIWQGDANGLALAIFADAGVPATVVNVAGPERLDVYATCQRLGAILDRPVRFRGEPSPTALLNNGCQAHSRYGAPRVSLDRIIDWTADWIRRGLPTWNKPTHFQTRDGRF